MKRLKTMTLLYAEDELITKIVYTKFFKSLFKDVYTAVNGKQALELYYTKKPDVVILDINMPLMNGLDVCKAIRKDDQQTKIIMLTSVIDKKILFQSIELGLTTYLEKPVTEELLISSFKKLNANNNEEKSIQLWVSDNQVISWSLHKRELISEEKIIHLTKKEKAMLEMLILSKQEKVTYQKIYDTIWLDDPDKEYNEATIKSIINGLRSKLPPKVIQNVYGLGYYLKKD